MNEPTQGQIMANQLKQYQSLSTSGLERIALKRIEEALIKWGDKAYIAFSGGTDSVVLADLVWKVDHTIPAVFCDTGLEFPELRDLVKSYGDKVIWVKPDMRFDTVIKKYGYPIIGKNQSMAISRCRRTKDPFVKEYRQFGTRNGVFSGKAGVIPKCWHYLLSAPFLISDSCCEVMKKRPLKKYQKETGRKPFIGILAEESAKRREQYYKRGCNSFDGGTPQSNPLMTWRKHHVLDYIRLNNLPVASVYGEIFKDIGKNEWTTSGEKRTGCMFCMFGVHLEKGENRFQRMSRTHPKQYDYCINKLGCGEVLDFIGVDYKPVERDLFGDKID